MLNATLIGSRELVTRFGQMPDHVQGRLNIRVQAYTLDLQRYVIRSKLSGQVLNVRSGDLRRSIQERMVINATSAFGYVYSSGDVKYAAIHEFGGVILHPGGTAYMTIFAAGRGATRWISNANPLASQAKRTRPHPIPMPERSFLRSGLQDKAETYRVGLLKAATSALRSKIMGTDETGPTA